MGRRVSNGTVGAGPTFGSLVATTNTLSTAGTNTNLIIDPAGTGTTQFVGNIQLNAQGEVRLGDSDSSNYVALRATATVTANRTLTFPDSVGSSGQVLQTDGSGNLSWVAQTTAGVSISDSSGSSALRVIHGPNTTSGAVTTFNSLSSLTFIPSTGQLNASIGAFPTILGSTTSGGTLTINSTSNGTKAVAGILMNENISATSTATGTLVVTGGVGIGGTLHAANITTAGTLTAGTVTETSSIAYKENLEPINDALNLILNLQAYTYDRKDGSRFNEPGLIKEEVEKIIPNLTTEDGILYTKLSAYFVEAIKELKAEIDFLKSQKG